MKQNEFVAMHFPKFELTYRLTSHKLSRIRWNSCEEEGLFWKKDTYDNMACIASNNDDRIYLASKSNLKAIDVESGKALWTKKHDMSLYEDTIATMDYVKKSECIERLIITTGDSIAIFDAKDGKQISYSPGKYL